MEAGAARRDRAPSEGSATGGGHPAVWSLRAWLPVIVWSAIISLLSTSWFSAANTSAFIDPILRWLLPSASVATIAMLHNLIRKSAHLTEYAILFGLLTRKGGPLAGRLLWALAFCLVYAMLDEGHQYFVPGRTSSIYDVGIDFTGALAFGLIRDTIARLIGVA